MLLLDFFAKPVAAAASGNGTLAEVSGILELGNDWVFAHQQGR